MRRVLLPFTAIALLACAPIHADEKPSDVSGWSKTRWGMTNKEILEAVPEAKQSPGADWLAKGVNVGIEAYEIDGTDYTIMFIPDTKGILERVQIAPRPLKGPNGLPSSPPVMEKLEALLVDKYGSP